MGWIIYGFLLVLAFLVGFGLGYLKHKSKTNTFPVFGSTGWAANLLGLSVKQIIYQIKIGRLPYKKVGRIYFLYHSDLIEWRNKYGRKQ